MGFIEFANLLELAINSCFPLDFDCGIYLRLVERAGRIADGGLSALKRPVGVSHPLAALCKASSRGCQRDFKFLLGAARRAKGTMSVLESKTFSVLQKRGQMGRIAVAFALGLRRASGKQKQLLRTVLVLRSSSHRYFGRLQGKGRLRRSGVAQFGKTGLDGTARDLDLL